VSAREVLIALAQFDLSVCEGLDSADCTASLQRSSEQERVNVRQLLLTQRSIMARLKDSQMH
jgi:hypothetical protein